MVIKKNCSPQIDNLASSGAVFRNAYSQTNSTLPSHLSILTSSYIQDHGVYTNDVINNSNLPGVETYFAGAGFKCGAVVSVLHLGRIMGLEGAFDSFIDLEKAPPKFMQFSDKYRQANETTDLAIDWISKQKQRGFFLWVHYFDPHMPYLAPEPFRSRFIMDPLPERIDISLKLSLGKLELEEVLSRKEWSEVEKKFFSALSRAELPLHEFHYNGIGVTEEEVAALSSLYDGEIAFTDSEIGRLLNHLEDTGLKNNTLVTITADHGESIAEHDIVCSHRGLYLPSVKVPLIMSLPGKIQAGTLIDSRVQTLDISPTLLDLTGLQIPEHFKGLSLVPLLEGTSERTFGERTLVFEHANTAAIGILEDRWKWIISLEDQFSLEPSVYRHLPKELYDIMKDPEERKNLITGGDSEYSDADVALIDKKMSSIYSSWYDSLRVHSIRNGEHSSSEDLKESLKALGYIQ